MTATAPDCPNVSAAKPIAKGNTVPPNRPIIISPDTSFFHSEMKEGPERR